MTLNITSEDFELFKVAFECLERLAGEGANWIPSIILAEGDEKIVIGYGESGDPCILEAYNVEERVRGIMDRRLDG